MVGTVAVRKLIEVVGDNMTGHKERSGMSTYNIAIMTSGIRAHTKTL